MDLSLFLNPIFSPELAVLISALIALLVGVFNTSQNHILSNTICLMGVIIAIVLSFNLLENPICITYPFFTINAKSIYLKILLLLSGLFVLIYKNYIKNIAFELSILINLSLLGMMVLISSSDFIIFYISLELQSLTLYIMASSNRNQLHSTEAGLKYFILGAIASGLILFGISLIYGFTGQLSFDYFHDLYRSGFDIQNVPLAVIIGLILIMTGLFFKISAVPFHMWTPDVYEGSPTIFTTFFATATKIAVLTIFGRIFLGKFSGLYPHLLPIVIIVALLSLVVGAFGGLKQTKLKRLFAYSSIANIGFILLGFITTETTNFSYLINYITIYTSLVLASFAIILTIENHTQETVYIKQLVGFAKNNSLITILFSIILFSLAGIPPFAGFFAKLYIIESLIHNNYSYIAVIALALTVISAYYYLNIIKAMYFDESNEGSIIKVKFGGIIRFLTILIVIFNVTYIFYYAKIKLLLNSLFISIV